MELEQIHLYRMIHVLNIPNVLRHGITHKSSPRANPDFITIGDLSLINTRNGKAVRVGNGNDWDTEAQSIVLGDFIPFYFGIKMPMLYVIQNGGNFVEKATPAENIVYLACSLARVMETCKRCYFSDGHATDSFTTFFDWTKVPELPSLIDWNAVKSSYWGGLENLNVKRKKQAEFLVGEDIPASCISGYVCFNELAKQELIAMGVEMAKIKVIPNAYF
jgi:hypothetical protein